MNNLELKVDALIKLCIAEDDESREKAKRKLRRLAIAPNKPAAKFDIETEVQKFMMELAIPDHLKGYPYIVQAVVLATQDRKVVEHITGQMGVYQKIADTFEDSPNRVERSIRSCIDAAWIRCDPDVLNKYFGCVVSASMGRPTNSEFIARAANIILMRMKGVSV